MRFLIDIDDKGINSIKSIDKEDKKKRHQTWWAADLYISHFIIENLNGLIENGISYPADGIKYKEWKKVMKKMGNAFKIHIKETNWDKTTDKQQKEKKEGMELFIKYFGDLWD